MKLNEEESNIVNTREFPRRLSAIAIARNEWIPLD